MVVHFFLLMFILYFQLKSAYVFIHDVFHRLLVCICYLKACIVCCSGKQNADANAAAWAAYYQYFGGAGGQNQPPNQPPSQQPQPPPQQPPQPQPAAAAPGNCIPCPLQHSFAIY